MKNFIRLGSLSVLFLAFTCQSTGTVSSDRPESNMGELNIAKKNVIFILSDDHRYDFMGFMGRPSWLETPAMDRMAAQGVHVANAFVTTSLCSPSRASILTGQYSAKHGVIDNNSRVPDEAEFFPEYLQDAGYKTAYLGKWHMGGSSDEPRPGFDKWVSYKGQGTYFDPKLNVDGEAIEKAGYTADIVTDYALEWLDETKDDEEPFFMYVSHKSVHAGFEPAKRHQGMYSDVELELPPSFGDTKENYSGLPRWVNAQRNSWHGVDYMYHGETDFDNFYRDYNETLVGLDENIGRVLDYLEENDLAESTLVIYMGDNGFSFGEHGLIDKRHMYEESMRVPFLAMLPGTIPSESKVEHLIQNIDVGPTILDYAGLEIPDHMDGKSFLPILKGEDISWRDYVLYQYYWEYNFPQTPTTFGIRNDRYKYIFYHGIWDTDELYDLQDDPWETKNLAQLPEFAERKRTMQDKMFAEMKASGADKVKVVQPTGFKGDKRGPKKRDIRMSDEN